MCGRFTLTASGEALAEAFDLDEAPVGLEPRYNIAPSQEILTVVSGAEGRRRLERPRWGLASSGVPGRPLINVRAESAGSRPRFREAFAKRRCLVPADGFYEWQAVPGASRKQPHYIRLARGGLFALAGIWEPGRDGPSTCALLTTEPTPALREIHDRMPVILPVSAHAAWLDPANDDLTRLDPLLAPYAADLLASHPVSRRVNSARNDEPELVNESLD
jgi:putative SOS response-associated peptidase YedK